MAMEGGPGDVEQVTCDELLARGRDVLFVDVREPAEWMDGHIPGALHIPLGDLEERSGEIPRNREVVMVCRSGRRSEMACRYLASAGYTRIRNLKGGMLAWTGEIE
jgi:rhodanese-related sulfurtransferase